MDSGTLYINGKAWGKPFQSRLEQELNCSGIFPRLGFRREVQNISHFRTCHFGKIYNKIGDKFLNVFLYLFESKTDNCSEYGELNHSQDFKSNNKNEFDGNRTYLIISKPVNLQSRYQQTNNHHHGKTKQRNDSTSQINSIKCCRKSERQRSYSKSRPKEETKHQQKICLVLSGD